VITAVTTLVLVSVACTSGARAAGHSGCASSAPGCQLWLSRFNDPVNAIDSARAMAVSPDSGTVYVTGRSHAASGSRHTFDYGYATVAYDAATGAQLWLSRYDGFDATPVAVAVSPDGRTVFVTGSANVTGTRYDYVTIAYSAATGAELWKSDLPGSGNSENRPAAIAVSPDGGTVFVTGTSDGGTKLFRFSYGYDTVAYDAATGARRWQRVFEGPIIGRADHTFFAEATSLAVSPDGRTVFVTGTSQSRATRQDYATIAYGAANGTQIWVRRYSGPSGGNDTATAVEVAPGGGRVFVTGRSMAASGRFNFATLSYDAATGRQLWARRYRSRSGDSTNVMLGVAPGGRTVFVSGSGGGDLTRGDAFVTVAYRAAAGSRLWASRYRARGYRSDDAVGLAVGPGGRHAYVTGTGWGSRGGLRDYVTLALGAATGARLWVARYNGPAGREDSPAAIVASPGGRRVYVTGTSRGAGTGFDYATIAYRG
jgi:putative pyrroloquinoline-quinone binding quinoprotein